MPTPSIRSLRHPSDRHLTLSLAAALGGPAMVSAVCATMVHDDDVMEDRTEEPADPAEQEDSVAPAARWAAARNC